MAKSSTSFTTGTSGNPSGRPSLPPEVTAFLREKTLAAVQKLWAICDTDGHEDQVTALRIFLAKCLPDVKVLDAQGEDTHGVLLSLLARLTAEERTAQIDALKEPTKQ